jgi:hypothetical protein
MTRPVANVDDEPRMTAEALSGPLAPGDLSSMITGTGGIQSHVNLS